MTNASADTHGRPSDPQSPSDQVRLGTHRFAGRLWALDLVLDWLAPGGSRFLLLKGEPGVGKSAFAAWIAGHGRVPSDHVAAGKLATARAAWSAVHFCRLKAGGTVEPQRFAGSIAKQLTDRSEQFARRAIRHIAPEVHIEQYVRENSGENVALRVETLIVGSRDAADVYNRAVRLPLQELFAAGAAPRPDSQLFMLVDGLDEAVSQPQPNIFTLLRASEDLPEGVRFLVTTREHGLVDQLRGRTTLDLSSLEHAERSDEDIRGYLRQRLAEDGIREQADELDSREQVIDNLVARAHGNFLYVEFLLDEVATGVRGLADLSGAPTDLYPLYREYLDRLIPSVTEPSGGELWLRTFQPLLGSLSVASPAAPQPALPRWLRWEPDELETRLGYVSQLTEVVPDVQDRRPGYRVYHRSLADFLSAAEYRDEDQPTRNPYFVSPKRQHERIARYYLSLGGSGNWSRVDRYALRQLVPHLRAWHDLASDPVEQDEVAASLYGTVLDDGFVARQQEHGEVEATAVGVRLALETALQRGDLDPVESMVTRLAGELEPELRALAREVAQQLQQVAPDRFATLARNLLR